MTPTAPSARRRPGVRVADVIGVAWVLAAAGAALAPAFVHGPFLGSIDVLARYGLSKNPSVVVHDKQAFDQVSEFIPWVNLTWTQLHHGHLPLWNPNSVLGLPLAFSWQAGVFSVPALISYLFPLHAAYSVQVITTLVVAGTGTYVFTRVLGVGVLGSTLAATAYELSGPFFGWLGWPIAAVMSWTGWILAATVLVVRGRHRVGSIAFLAVVLAAAVYAGQPDTLVLLASAYVVFVAALLAMRAPRLGGSGPIRRPLLDVVFGGAAGAALSAPLLLPGLQLIAGSLRTGKSLSKAIPIGKFTLVLFQGFDGLPVAGSRWFGSGYYTKTAVYLGAVAVVLVVVAVIAALKLRVMRPEVATLGVVAVVMAIFSYLSLAESFLDGLPLFGSVLWRRATMPMAFALAVLAGIGADVLARFHDSRAVRAWTGYGFGAVGVVLVLLWVAGRGHLPPDEAAIRARSFLWPTLCTALGLVVVGALAWRAGRRLRPATGGRARIGAGRAAVAVLLLGETVFLVIAGAPLMASSATPLRPTPAEAELARDVGSSVVAFGSNTCFGRQLGILPDANVALGVDELAVYEPLIPRTYGESWRATTGNGAAPVVTPGVPFSVFCPAVTSVALARRYGVGFILESRRHGGPRGTVFVARVGGEYLFRVPGGATATLTDATRSGGPPVTTVAHVERPGPASLRVTTDSRRAAVLRLHITDVPGWHASIDGHPLALSRYGGVMLQADIPPGRHVVELRYWPTTFTVGLVLAALGVVALGGAGVLGRSRRRRAGATTVSGRGRGLAA
jgi:hypothetical protein